MDNSYIEDLRKQVKKALKEDKMRYRHTLGVADTSACLAMRYGVDMQKADRKSTRLNSSHSV